MDTQLRDIVAQWALAPVHVITDHAFGLSRRDNVGVIIFEASDGCRYVLKRKSFTPDATVTEHAVLRALAAQGVPVPLPLRTSAYQELAEYQGHHYTLAPYLPGETHKDFFGDDGLIWAETNGRAIAQLHVALQSIDVPEKITTMDLIGPLAEWDVAGVPANASKDEREGLSHILKETAQQLTALSPTLVVQLIHRDAHPWNMLYHEGVFAGWLDFELSTRGYRIFDLCYCSTSQLAGIYADTAQRLRWFDVHAALCRGYQQIIALRQQEVAAIPFVMQAIQCLFVQYFTCQEKDDLASLNFEMLGWLDTNRAEVERCISE